MVLMVANYHAKLEKYNMITKQNKTFMEQVKIEVDEELLLALQKIHECQVIYLNTMGKYEDPSTLEDFGSHCECIIHTIKKNIADVLSQQMEEKVEEEYDAENK